MYDVLVGKAQFEIARGSLMTTETLNMQQIHTYRKRNHQWTVPNVSKFEKRIFSGYKRKDGSVETANYPIFEPNFFVRI